MAKDPSLEALVGRTAEVRAIRDSITALAEGRGQVLLLAGEPGIGKSTLARCAAALAERWGAAVYWGFCWEAGGAPAYWPWTQLLRSLVGDWELSQSERDTLPLLMPELSYSNGAAIDLQPDQARFQLLDSVRVLLSRIASRKPLVLLFEDVHAADKDSLSLLRHLARHVTATPILLIASYREWEARASAESASLWQMGREAKVLRLSRLSRSEVAEYLRSRTGRTPSNADLQAWFETTSGNPLFLSELVGLLDKGGSYRAVGGQLPATIEQVIRQQVGYLPDVTAQLLSTASLLGKSFDVSSLATLLQDTPQDIERYLAQASTAGIIVPRGAGGYEFSHGLYREVLYASLPPDERALLHLRYTKTLKKRVARGDEDGWSQLATHLASAGTDHRAEALEAWRHAAARARSRLAFDEAASLLETAVDTFAEGPRFGPADRCRLLLDCAEAMLLAGDLESGHAKSLDAFGIARTLEDAALMSTAALTYGSAIVVASVDQTLINMLQECLEALPRKDIGMRARVQARLAAALQPALDPKMPMDMARQAIEQARASGDKMVLYDSLRSAISALMDFAPPTERQTLNREFLKLAIESGDVPAQFRSHLRLMIDAAEMADRQAFDAAIESAERIAHRIGLPHYQWRVASARAMQAIVEGRYADAISCLDRAQAMAQRIEDLEPRVTIPVQRFAVLHDWDSEEAGSLSEIQAQLGEAYASGMQEAEFFIQPFIDAFTVTEAGTARKLIENPMFIRRSFAGSDRFSMVAVALLSLVADDRKLAEEVYHKLLPFKEQCAVTGLLGSVWSGPVALELGRLAMAQGNTRDARTFFVTALEIAERMASKPFIARIERERARLAAASGDAEAARQHEQAARDLYAALEMRLPKEWQNAPPPGEKASAPAAARISIEPRGEACEITFDGKSALIKHTKGMAMLVRLIRQPNSDIHVLELSDSNFPAGSAGGDAGPALDRRARDAYQRRVRELDEELEEAETMGDVVRRDALSEEREFIARELSRAFGLGGRARPQRRAAERARVNVRRRIKDAIDRIEEQLPGAGRYLESTIKTGSYCRYSPM